MIAVAISPLTPTVLNESPTTLAPADVRLRAGLRASARGREIPKCSTEPRFQPDSDDLFCGTLKVTDRMRKKHLFCDELTRKNSLRFDVESRMFSRTWKILDLVEFK